MVTTICEKGPSSPTPEPTATVGSCDTREKDPIAKTVSLRPPSQKQLRTMMKERESDSHRTDKEPKAKTSAVT